MSNGSWRDARSIADLGQNMALWLEGRIPSWPGYDTQFGYEENNGARHLIPVLAAANRAGFVTTDSQPGTESRGHDGALWRQRAFVSGYVCDRYPLLDRLLRLDRQGITVVRGWPRGQQVTLTDRDRRPHTTLGGFRLGRDFLTHEWNGIGRPALRELREHGVQIHLYDPEFGRDSLLWPALTGAVR
ncbi:hypothetical protein AB0M64_19810 [Streptomyces sp. NPDC051771]|uniref:DUF6919 domain-containing protein n=1 Tax=Streptomyces sp. NPDC051771 TaxID=3154847 RepID=UPI0034311492